MNISNPVSASVNKISFSFYEPENLKKMSVKAITNPQIFDTLNHPTTGGLYDPALGPYDKQTQCTTCLLDQRTCPGHFGHIDLAVPIYNSITFRRMYKMLQSVCHYCQSLRLSAVITRLYAAKFKLIHAGLLTDAASIEEHVDVKPRKKSDGEEVAEEEVVTGADQKEVIIAKIDKFVADALERGDRTVKNILISDALRKVERQFLLSIPSDACQNCRGQSPKYRCEGQTKIFQKPLSAKKQAIMSARGLKIPKLFGGSSDIILEDLENDIYITPISVKAILQKLWENEHHMMDLLYGSSEEKPSSPSIFFLTVVAVTPSKFRPVSKMNGQLFEHPQNIYLTEIIKNNMSIQDIQQVQQHWLSTNEETDRKIITEKNEYFLKQTVESWIKLQDSVNFLIDSSKAPIGKGGKTPPPGIRQLLEKKEGLFRKHMMGKRVNYAARSVISPDPYIETSEIGIPPVFAKKLTYPEPVTAHNVSRLRECVVNGPEVWPGATHVQNEDGTLIALGVFDEAGRKAIANQLLTPTLQKNNANGSQLFTNNNKKVYRHLRNGDFLLMNRQPTLHKPSIMAHTARVLTGEKTIRMHYANCNTYNADFDGDEMNAHFPQNEIARAEAMLIARNDKQYLVPTDGGVLRGLIQDHVDAGVHMCSRDTFFIREKYIQLVYAGLREANAGSSIGNGNIEDPIDFGRDGRFVLQPPGIIKPVERWTGKQVISTILYNLTPANRNALNLISKCRIPAQMWGGDAPEEQIVLIMDGYLLTGILDKSQFGASSNGLVHAIYEVYGPAYAGKLLSILGRLFTSYLQSAGFTCRMDDLLLTPEGNLARHKLIDSANTMGHGVASEYVNAVNPIEIKIGLEEVLRDSEKMAGLDSAMKSKTNKVTSTIISTCVPSMLLKPFPQNNMQVMTVSGAKGSSVNVSQISCLLGQQELEGKRVPTMVSGKTLPSFQAFETSARSGGYITGRFLTGIKPQEYYFHCFDDRHQILTTEGFKWISDPTLQDARIATYNPDTKEIEYHPCSKWFRQDGEFTMVDVFDPQYLSSWDNAQNKAADNSEHIYLSTTDGHDWWARTGCWTDTDFGEREIKWKAETSFAKVKASEFVKSQDHDAPGANTTSISILCQAEGGIKVPVDEQPHMMVALGLKTEEQYQAAIRLYGYWLNDGTLDLKGKEVRFTSFHGAGKHWIEEQLKQAGLRLLPPGNPDNLNGFHIYHYDQELQSKQDATRLHFVIKNQAWWNLYFNEYGTRFGMTVEQSDSLDLYKSAKWMAKWIWNMDKIHLRLLIEGLEYTDACPKDLHHSIYTSSPSFRDEVLRTMLHAGYAAYFLLHEPADPNYRPGSASRKHALWQVLYQTTAQSTNPTIFSDTGVKTRVSTQSVYCVTVPPHNLIIARMAKADGHGIIVQASKPTIIGNCMAGREGLIDTAVKTSRSGYLQRCLIKHLEGIKVHYDHTVRDADGSVLQFHYGEDSLDVCKQTTLNKFDFNALNYLALVSRYDPSVIAGKVDEKSVAKFLRKNKKKASVHDPVLNIFSPSKYVGAVSDKFSEGLKEYINKNPSNLIRDSENQRGSWSNQPIDPENFEGMMNLKYMHSLVEPGESVGLLAAQSIGEPSTQMTLNTFHFAGFGAKNVTLGIPRLREIIMTASANIKTPLMRLPLKSGVSEKRKLALCEEISKLVLSQIMEGVIVTENLTKRTIKDPRMKLVKVRLNFWHKDDYFKQYNMTPIDLGRILEKKLIPQLERAISRDLQSQYRRAAEEDGDEIGVGKSLRNTSKKSEEEDEATGDNGPMILDEASEDDAESDGEQGDGDATSSKKKSNKRQQSSYDDDDEGGEDEESNGDAEENEAEEKDKDGRTRLDRITEEGKYVCDYRFDQKSGKWCEISFKFDAETKKVLMAALCETVCEKIVIHEIRGIQRCFPQPNENENDKSVNIGTEGCSLQGIWDYAEDVDINQIYTNDVSAILRTYGVEAARSAITQEISSVFGVYGIGVDSRHLSLIGDFMTFEGGYKPFNRMGMDSNPSPFTQMSYERTTHFLTTSTLAGDFDPVDSPSARIVMGRLVSGGTGAFDVLQPIVK